MFLAYIIATTIEEKLLSIRTISLASLAISVLTNIAKPISLLLNAGASFVPSPVTATTLSNSLNPRTSAYLCIGCECAVTRRLFVIPNKPFFIFYSIVFDFLYFLSGTFSDLIRFCLCFWTFTRN